MQRLLRLLLPIAWMGLVLNADAQPVRPFPEALPDFFYYAPSPPRVVRLPDGRTLIPGRWSRGFAVARAMPDGSVDTAFGRNGVAELVLWGGGEYDSAPLLVPLADGRVLAGGNVKDDMHVPNCAAYYSDCNIHIAIFRLHEDGSVDSGFNRYGRLVVRVGDPTVAGFDDGGDRFLRFLAVALVSTLGGALAMLWVYWGVFIVVVGASAAVSGLLAAAIPIMFGRPGRPLGFGEFLRVGVPMNLLMLVTGTLSAWLVF